MNRLFAALGDAPAGSPVAASALPTRRKFLVFGVMAFGQFMALLDIQIVAASLNDIQAGLSAGPDEISWVQTAYLMAELVMIPFSAFLAQALSSRWLFALSATLFTVSSVLCGLAWNIGSMVAFRAVQGFVGGAMVPTVFAVGFSLFTGKQRALIPAILGTVSTLAPALGPTVGGWITQTINWRWIFFINVLPGLLVAIGSLLLIPFDQRDLRQLRRIDWTHLLSMAVFLGGLEYVLEEGPRYDWFDDPDIRVAAWLSLVGLLLFLERSFYSQAPIVKLTPFRKPTFVFACIFNLTIGFGLYSAVYLVPVYLGRVRDFDSLQIGSTVFVVGLAQILSTVVAARLSQRVDQRYVVTAGLLLFSGSLWLSSSMTPEWGFAQLFVPQFVRGFALMLCIVPSVNMALGGFEGRDLRLASGLFNLMRNLGGAIGIAVVNTWLQDNARSARLRLAEALGGAPDAAAEAVARLAQALTAHTPDPGLAQRMAQAVLSQRLAAQALTVAFDDVFRLMAWVFLAALILVPFCKVAPPAAAPVRDAH